jgi:uncharacterized membrane protein YdjX (TVP38/TMEM64 family)
MRALEDVTHSLTRALNRTVTQDWMKRQLVANPKWHVFMSEVEKNAWKITLLTRLLPFPFGLVNGLFAVRPIRSLWHWSERAWSAWALLHAMRARATDWHAPIACAQLSSISFPVFLMGSFVGLLPFQLMWTYFGTTLYVKHATPRATSCIAPS